jgi:predicted DNA-binding transcriptional regulator AlpA
MQNIIHALEDIILGSKLFKINKDYLDSQDACFFLGISKSTLYKMNLRKELPYFKPRNSKKVYYLRTDLVEYITQNKLMSQAEITEHSINFLNKKKGGSNV